MLPALGTVTDEIAMVCIYGVLPDQSRPVTMARSKPDLY